MNILNVKQASSPEQQKNCDIFVINSEIINKSDNKIENEHPRFIEKVCFAKESKALEQRAAIFWLKQDSKYKNAKNIDTIGYKNKNIHMKEDETDATNINVGVYRDDLFQNVKRGENLLTKSFHLKTKKKSKLITCKFVKSRFEVCTINLHDIVTHLLSISNDIETNPGPNYSKENLFVATYNVQGCKDHKKAKRLFHQLKKLPFSSNCIFNLQETHFTENKTLQYHWKWGSTQSYGSSSSAGVAILYDKSYFDEILNTNRDNEGRFCSLVARKEDELYLFANIYAPNDHYASVRFFETVKNKIDETIENYPTINVILSNDFNVILNPKVDSIGRNQTNQEKKVVECLESIMIKLNLVDSYRRLNTYGGFTWGRNNPVYKRSRLDLILINKSLSNSLVASSTMSHINESDHLLLVSELMIQSCEYGPGIKRVNSSLLENPEIKEKIRKELEENLATIPEDWNPHQTLDYYKYRLRVLLLQEGKIKCKIDKNRLALANQEIERLKTHLDKILLNSIDGNLDTGYANRIRDAIDLA